MTRTSKVPFSVSSAGATAATRYVGGTTTGVPTTGTFVVGDFLIGQDGYFWVCVAGGTPGTWKQSQQNVTDMVRFRASLPLAMRLSTQPAARTALPTVSLSVGSVDGATPTQWKANTSTSATALNPAFTLSGGVYQRAGSASPDYEHVRTTPVPQNPVGHGNAVADFVTDSPAVSIPYMRSYAGAMRVLVDDVEVFRTGVSNRSNTAQAGAASTITLDASASATNGFYVGQWIHLTGGTGQGQYAQITAYVGSTKVATVSPAWPTVPDNTSTFEITPTRIPWSNSYNTSSSVYYFKLDYNGERRPRHYRVETSGLGFRGIYVTSAIDSVYPHPVPDGAPTYWCGDSFGGSTGTDAWYSAIPAIVCDKLGWQLHNMSIGGTGFLNPGTNSLTFADRLTPPLNAWRIFIRGATAGTFTLTQNSLTTSTIAYNETIANIQTAVNTTFGSGNFYVAGESAQSFFLIGRSTNATFAGAMTANFAGLTGGMRDIVQYTGELVPQLPTDGLGNILPFNLVLQGGHNDTTDNNAGYTTTALGNAVTALIDTLESLYPMMTLYVIGNMYLPGGSVPTATTNANTAYASAVASAATKVNGKTPYVDTLTVPWMTGTGYAGSLQANGNSDLTCTTDGIHPTTYGHYLYGTRIADAIIDIAASA